MPARPEGQLVVAVMLLAVPVLGCMSEAPNDRAGDVSDSGGVRVVSTSEQSLRDLMPWSLSRDDSFLIGAEDRPGGLLNGVRDIAGLGEGRVAVLDASNTLRIFSPTGSLMRSLGGAGQGPGEFGYAQAIRVVDSDIVGVWDPMLHRETVFRLDEGPPHVRPIPKEPLQRAMGSGASAEVVAVLSDSLALGFSTLREAPRAGAPTRPQITLLSLGLDTDRIDTLGAWADATRVLVSTQAGQSEMIALNPRWFTFAVGETSPTVCAGNQAAAVVDCTSPPEGTRWSVRWVQPATRVDQDGRDRLIQEYRIGAGARYPEAILREIVSALPVMDTLPFFESIHVDDVGRLWIVRIQDGERSALIFDELGEAMAQLSLPSGIEIFSIVDDALYSVVEDDLGVETVQRFVINRR